MSKKQEFIKYVKELQSHCDAYSTIEMNDEARLYWEAFCGNDDVEKPMFTDNGKLILKYLQDNVQETMWKAKKKQRDNIESARCDRTYIYQYKICIWYYEKTCV